MWSTAVWMHCQMHYLSPLLLVFILLLGNTHKQTLPALKSQPWFTVFTARLMSNKNIFSEYFLIKKQVCFSPPDTNNFTYWLIWEKISFTCESLILSHFAQWSGARASHWLDCLFLFWQINSHLVMKVKRNKPVEFVGGNSFNSVTLFIQQLLVYKLWSHY